MKTILCVLSSVIFISWSAQASTQSSIPVETSTSVQASNNVSASQCHWSQWQSFKAHYIEDGRVVDSSDERNITTSEGQSYGMFFALVANDKAAFQQQLDWTEEYLAGGDLTARLPAWLWGTKPDGSKGILDTNTASDSDLWIAYSLVEAGQKWDNYYYQTLGHLLASRILREETATVDGYGKVLLPGREGFILGDNHVRFNPSYFPLQILTRMKSLYPDYQWQELVESSDKLLLESMPKGISPDWAELTTKGIQPDSQTESLGSYNAIRTYLWAATLANDSPYKKPLIEKMQPLVKILQDEGKMPEELDAQTGNYQGQGGVGINAAVIPLLQVSGKDQLASQFRHQTEQALPTIASGSYYNSVLALFAQGWLEGRYQFDKTGQLMTNWDDACQ
ncbi:cellulase [Vibrio sp. S17_S38]|uniref:cellulose synthase complex periplasmic endoglucanase BcsZ n=1 Tax=Vibrio sp. S17_S38 TaxID=2720229 RepID=UPI001680BA2B|nr:cellulose synthase complex periplasmic endoglucanase BcsZ [Vibrio sp. S17_S38]MBD1574116.1 cellulase [Vibrio sp. S17_S38]